MVSKNTQLNKKIYKIKVRYRNLTVVDKVNDLKSYKLVLFTYDFATNKQYSFTPFFPSTQENQRS